jgi:hypothetical protein
MAALVPSRVANRSLPGDLLEALEGIGTRMVDEVHPTDGSKLRSTP